jgi:uncharacterized protein
MNVDYIFYVVAFLTVLVIAISKGGLGGGFAVIGVPILSLFISPMEAAAILAPMFCIMDAFAFWAYPPKTWDKKNVRILLPAIILGIALGIMSFRFLDDRYIRLLVGGISIIFSLHWWLSRKARKLAQEANFIRGSLWGTLSGFTTFLAHSGGPPLSVYLLPQHLDKTTLAGTSFIVFSIGNLIKLVGYIGLEQLNHDTLMTASLLIPAVPIGVFIGKQIHNRINADTFYKVCYALLIPIGLKLLADGLMT